MVVSTTTTTPGQNSIGAHLKYMTVSSLKAVKHALTWFLAKARAFFACLWQLGYNVTLAVAKGISAAANWTWSISCAAWIRIIQKLRKWWFGELVEVPKLIIRRHPQWYRRAWRGLCQCSIHMLPLAATITVVGLNTGTYFIGVDLPGWDTDQWQDFYRLALQVVAKLYVRTTCNSHTYSFIQKNKWLNFCNRHFSSWPLWRQSSWMLYGTTWSSAKPVCHSV